MPSLHIFTDRHFATSEDPDFLCGRLGIAATVLNKQPQEKVRNRTNIMARLNLQTNGIPTKSSDNLWVSPDIRARNPRKEKGHRYIMLELGLREPCRT